MTTLTADERKQRFHRALTKSGHALAIQQDVAVDAVQETVDCVYWNDYGQQIIVANVEDAPTEDTIARILAAADALEIEYAAEGAGGFVIGALVLPAGTRFPAVAGVEAWCVAVVGRFSVWGVARE